MFEALFPCLELIKPMHSTCSARTNRFFVPSKVLPNGTFKHFVAVNPHEIVLVSLESIGFWDTLYPKW